MGFVSVDHDEDGVFFPPVPDVVFVARVFDAGVHDAGASVASNERAGDVVPAVCAAAASFVGFHGEGGAVVEGEGGGECVAVVVHVGEGDVCDVSAFEDRGVFFRRAVLVEDDFVVGGVLVHSSYCTICTRSCLHVWTRCWVVVPARLGACLPVSVRGLGGSVRSVLWARDRVGVPLVGVWVASRERAPTRGLRVGWGCGGCGLRLGAVRPLVR